MIVLDPNSIGTLTDESKTSHLLLQKEALAETYGNKEEPERKKKEANKMKGKNKIGKKLARKEQMHRENQKKLFSGKSSEGEPEKTNDKIEPVEGIRPALDRFVK